MDEQTLEPCPFCKGEARWSLSFTDGRDWGNIYCAKCMASSDYGTRARVTVLWNTRAAHSVIAGKVAELEAAVVALADGADRCAQAPHFIMQPFLAIFRKHGATIAGARQAALAPYPERRSE